jgi:hypothetical protein
MVNQEVRLHATEQPDLETLSSEPQRWTPAASYKIQNAGGVFHDQQWQWHRKPGAPPTKVLISTIPSMTSLENLSIISTASMWTDRFSMCTRGSYSTRCLPKKSRKASTT